MPLVTVISSQGAAFPGRIFASSLSIVYLFDVRKNKKAKTAN